MADIKDWSGIDAQNNQAPPDGWPEGQPAKTLNDSGRAVMGGVRRQWEDKEWFDHGHDYTFVDATNFSVAGQYASVYHEGRRFRARGTNTGEVYGEITSVSQGTDTQVSIVLDSGSLIPEIDSSESIAVGIGVTGKPITAESISNLNVAPIGALTAFAGSVAPVSWLFCDGSTYSTSAYPLLFSVIGYTYGGAGSTFAVPDMRSRMPIGVGQGAGLSDYLLNAEGGEEQVSLSQTNQLPQHQHFIYQNEERTDVPGTPDNNDWLVYRHDISTNQEFRSYNMKAATGDQSGWVGRTSYSGGDYLGQGDGQPHPNMVPYRALHFIIFAGE